jgi:hypothetical protein
MQRERGSAVHAQRRRRHRYRQAGRCVTFAITRLPRQPRSSFGTAVARQSEVASHLANPPRALRRRAAHPTTKCRSLSSADSSRRLSPSIRIHVTASPRRTRLGRPASGSNAQQIAC